MFRRHDNTARLGGRLFRLFGGEAFDKSVRYEGSSSGEAWNQVGKIDAEWFDGDKRGFSGVTISDVNGDGCRDLLASEGTYGRTLLAMGDCAGRWNLCPEETFPLVGDGKGFGWGVATGDFNGDGRVDVASGIGTKDGGLAAWVQIDPDGDDARVAQGQGPVESSVSRGSGIEPLSP